MKRFLSYAWNLLTVSENNLQQSRLEACIVASIVASTVASIKIEKNLNGNAEDQQLDGVFRMFLSFGNLKNV